MITSPFIPKYLSAPRCATLRGLIYLIGDNTKKVHVYNPEANIWQKVAGLEGIDLWVGQLFPPSHPLSLLPAHPLALLTLAELKMPQSFLPCPPVSPALGAQLSH